MANSDSSAPGPKPLLSTTVQQALKQFPDERPIPAWELVQRILEWHPEYGNGLANRISASDWRDGPWEEQMPGQWMQKVFDLLKSEAAEATKGKEKVQEALHPIRLHGRLLILGLSAADPQLGAVLFRKGLAQALLDEIEESPESVFLQEALRLLKELENRFPVRKGQTARFPLRGSSPPQHDVAIRRAEEDLLGRGAFAGYLAQFVETLYKGAHGQRKNGRDGAFAIHLSGSWGSGKTSLWELFIRELNPGLQPYADWEKAPASVRDNCNWIPCVFPAWQHQDMEPAWWPLMKHMSDAVKPQLSPWQRFVDWAWHIWHDRSTLLLMVGLLALLGFIVRQVLEGLDIIDSAAGLNTLLGLAATLLLLVQGLRGSVFMDSASSAKQFAEKTANPNRAIVQRMARLTGSIGDKKLAVFIDNLDRCQSHYAIDLLEAVQTLFQNQNILFVVAADRNWLHACYEDHYATLSPNVSQPGQSLGMMFLEKAFQLTTPLPLVQGKRLAAYWSDILEEAPGASAKAQEEVSPGTGEAELEKELQASKSPLDLDAFVAGRENEAPELLQKRLAMAMQQLQSEANEKRLQHDLNRYAHLLAPNPRSMKLLANNINVRTALLYASGMRFDRHQLYLWSILKSRWPKMVEDISRKPVLYRDIISAESRTQQDKLYDRLQDELQYLVDLLHSDAVQAILKAEGVSSITGEPEPAFDPAFLKRYAPLL
jgi:hypothetical protein